MSREVPPVLQVLAFVGAAWYSGLLGSAWDSWSTHYARIKAEKVRVAAIEKDGQELAFRTVCPDFFEQKWIDRQLSTLSWCNDYRDRL
ncbi:hypothetical protein V6R85_23925 [Agrobacterium sp. CCNWLW32]|uniref:hypothetical protein n=1 Tax=Agrobacterium sp. CCNWLW32 TaxID=3122072 RepID=UPI00300F88E2